MLGASSGGAGFFLLLIVAFAFLYFVLVRPQKRRQVQSQRMLQGLKVGDEVLTAGGIYGRITSLGEDDDVLVEIAPQLTVRVARRAIGGVVGAPADEPPDEPEADAEDGVGTPAERAEPPDRA